MAVHRLAVLAANFCLWTSASLSGMKEALRSHVCGQAGGEYTNGVQGERDARALGNRSTLFRSQRLIENPRKQHVAISTTWTISITRPSAARGHRLEQATPVGRVERLDCPGSDPRGEARVGGWACVIPCDSAVDVCSSFVGGDVTWEEKLRR